MTRRSINVSLLCLITAVVSYVAVDQGSRPSRPDRNQAIAAAVAAQAAKPADSVDDLGVCPKLVVDKLPVEILARTRFRDRPAVARFLAERGADYDVIRQRLLPALFARLGPIRRCYQEHAATATIAKLSARIRSDGGSATLSDLRVERIDPEAGGRREAALACLDDLSKALPIRVEPAPGARFMTYDDLYVNYITVPLGKNALDLARRTRPASP
jgi:hypothetical protein